MRIAVKRGARERLHEEYRMSYQARRVLTVANGDRCPYRRSRTGYFFADFVAARFTAAVEETLADDLATLRTAAPAFLVAAIFLLRTM